MALEESERNQEVVSVHLSSQLANRSLDDLATRYLGRQKSLVLARGSAHCPTAALYSRFYQLGARTSCKTYFPLIFRIDVLYWGDSIRLLHGGRETDEEHLVQQT